MAKAKKDETAGGPQQGITRARVLVACTIDGVSYRPDQIVEGPSAVIEAATLSGDVDPHPDAVAYAETLVA